MGVCRVLVQGLIPVLGEAARYNFLAKNPKLEGDHECKQRGDISQAVDSKGRKSALHPCSSVLGCLLNFTKTHNPCTTRKKIGVKTTNGLKLI